MHKKSIIFTGITSLLFLLSINAQAKIYKWIDANGQTHYSAQPPKPSKQKIKAENIEDKIKAHAGKYRPPSKTSAEASNIEEDSNDDNNEEKLSGPDKKLVKYCNGQRKNLKQLRKNFRNVWIDAKGKRTSLNQKQRKEKVAQLEQQIIQDCSEVMNAES